MKKLIENTIETYNRFDKKLNSKDYKNIVMYLQDKDFVLILKNDNIFDDKFVQYVFDVARYYIRQGLVDDIDDVIA